MSHNRSRAPAAVRPGLILGYARTWRLLLDYDEGKLGVPAGSRPARGVLAYGEARRAPDALS